MQTTSTPSHDSVAVAVRIRLLWRAVLPMLLLTVVACDEGPVQNEGFIAIVTRSEAPPEVDLGGAWDLRVLEISGSLDIDIRQRVQPNDTVILTLPPASYDITVDGAPLACEVRGGASRRAVVYQGGQTSTVRFNYTCSSLLTIRTGTDGTLVDEDFVFRHTDPAGRLRSGYISSNDTVRLDDIAPGEHRVELAHVSPRCVITTDGGRDQRLEIELGRPRVVDYRLRCTDPELAPEILHLGSSYRDSVSVFYFEAVDPDPNGPLEPPYPDFDRYHWSLTDCRSRSILGPPANFDRAGFVVEGLSQRGSRLHGADTVRIATVLRVGLPDASVDGACTRLRVEDWRGNSSGFVADPIGDEDGEPPLISSFDVRYAPGSSASYLTFDLEATDPDRDLGGSFLFFLFRDGVLGIEDGKPELLSLRLEGFEETHVPDLLMETPTFNRNFTPEDILRVTAYVIDREGNFSTAVDEDAVE